MKLFGPKVPDEVAKRVPPGQRLVKPADSLLLRCNFAHAEDRRIDRFGSARQQTG